MATEWTDASTATYTAVSTRIGDLIVTVCLDDEGPMRPAYYWDIERIVGQFARQVDSGWQNTVGNARKAALQRAKEINGSS